MKITAKIKEIQSQPNAILLFKEGCFYKVYDQNLFWFCTTIKPIKVIFKYIKKNDLHLVYGGFPVSSLPNLKKEYPAFFDVIIDNAYGFSIQANTNIINYREWFNKKKDDYVFLASLETDNEPLDIVSRIKNFPLALKTPLEAFLFIKELQNNYFNKKNE